jgi:hypothetical protein
MEEVNFVVPDGKFRGRAEPQVVALSTKISTINPMLVHWKQRKSQN